MTIFPIWIAQDFTDEVHVGFKLFFGGDPIFWYASARARALARLWARACPTLFEVYSFFSSATNLGELHPFFVPCCQFSNMLAILFLRYFDISGIWSSILELSDNFYFQSVMVRRHKFFFFFHFCITALTCDCTHKSDISNVFGRGNAENIPL